MTHPTRRRVTPAELALEVILIALAFFATGAACIVIAALLTPLA